MSSPFLKGKKTVTYVTARPNNLRTSRREVKNDERKYLQGIVIGLYAVCEQKLAHPNRVLSLDCQDIYPCPKRLEQFLCNSRDVLNTVCCQVGRPGLLCRDIKLNEFDRQTHFSNIIKLRKVLCFFW